MTGQPFYQQMHNKFRREEPTCIRAPTGLSGKNLDLSTCSHKKIEKGYAPFLSYIGFSRSEDSIKSGGLVPGCFWNKQRQESIVLLTRVAIGSMPRPEVQALHSHEKPS